MTAIRVERNEKALWICFTHKAVYDYYSQYAYSELRCFFMLCVLPFRSVRAIKTVGSWLGGFIIFDECCYRS